MYKVVELMKSFIGKVFEMWLKFGQWVRILDDEGQVSLTNLAMYIALYKLATATSAGWTEIGTMFLALASYQVKRSGLLDLLPKETVEEAEDISGQMDELKSKVNALLIGKGLGK